MDDVKDTDGSIKQTTNKTISKVANQPKQSNDSNQVPQLKDDTTLQQNLDKLLQSKKVVTERIQHISLERTNTLEKLDALDNMKKNLMNELYRIDGGLASLTAMIQIK